MSQSIKLGLALGLTTMGRWRGEPVAYLYNGVRLPKLPSVTGNEFAYIGYNLDGYLLSLWSTKGVVKDDPNSSVDAIFPESSGNVVTYAYHLPAIEGQTWLRQGEGTITPNNSVVAPWWANTDVYTTDGNLYLAGSAPVPVYE